MSRPALPRSALAAVLVAVVAYSVASLPAWRTPGSPFDEGFSLAYPSRILDGAVPHRDFVTFYGPANYYLIAGAFAVAGEDQDVERAVGWGYRASAVGATAALALPFGPLAALAAVALVAMVLIPGGLAALAAVGALGAALCALALLAAAARRREATGDAGSLASALAAGVLAGLVALLRLDFGVALGVAVVPFLLLVGRRRLGAFAAGLMPAAVLYAVHVGVVGSDRMGRVISDLTASGPGRRLPVDLIGTEVGRMLSGLVLVALFSLAVAEATRRRGARVTAATLAGPALLAVALVPYALSRLDYYHVVVPMAAALSTLPGAAVAVGEALQPPRRLLAPVLASALAVLVLVAASSHELRSPLKQYVERLFGTDADWVEVGAGSRTFGMSAAAAAVAQPIVDAAVRERRAGARTVFVGSRELRRAWMNDVYLYFVLSDLEPASYYMEFNPLTVNREGSGLDRDLMRADLLVLNSLYDNPWEPNESRKLGPEEPNLIVARHFCRVVRSGTLELLRRCRNPGIGR